MHNPKTENLPSPYGKGRRVASTSLYASLWIFCCVKFVKNKWNRRIIGFEFIDECFYPMISGKVYEFYQQSTATWFTKADPQDYRRVQWVDYNSRRTSLSGIPDILLRLARYVYTQLNSKFKWHDKRHSIITECEQFCCISEEEDCVNVIHFIHRLLESSTADDRSDHFITWIMHEVFLWTQNFPMIWRAFF